MAKRSTRNIKLFKLFKRSYTTPALSVDYPIIKTREIIPSSISTPSYYLTGLVEKTREPTLKSPMDIVNYQEAIVESCGYAASMRYFAKYLVKEGITTEQINQRVHKFCVKTGIYPAALDYKGFPKSVSTSVNEVACHGIPDSRPLVNGDILKIDCMAFINGYYGDCCGTYIVGEANEEIMNLVYIARKCLNTAIKSCGPNVPFKEIGNIISKIAEKEKLSVVENYTGHGIGRNLHSKPNVFHTRNNFDEGVMKVGMTFTIEPILTTGSGETYIHSDGWSVVTKDRKPCAQFEETIIITSGGAKVLTKYDGADSNPEFVIDRLENDNLVV